MKEEIEKTKEKLIREVEFIPKMTINNTQVEPYIIITESSGNIKVIINKIKIYRTLALKNQIEQSLDIVLVDKIVEVLNKLSQSEEVYENEVKP